jgi:hypothetical protein
VIGIGGMPHAQEKSHSDDGQKIDHGR